MTMPQYYIWKNTFWQEESQKVILDHSISVVHSLNLMVKKYSKNLFLHYWKVYIIQEM